MLIRFKCKASADVIMLDVHAKRLLEMMGKDNPLKGIVCPEDLPEALQRLEQALQALEEQRKQQPKQQTDPDQRTDPAGPEVGMMQGVGWAQRAQPLKKMLEMALKHKANVTWGT
jgi:Domain of unknown function (DUF1840)